MPYYATQIFNWAFCLVSFFSVVSCSNDTQTQKERKLNKEAQLIIPLAKQIADTVPPAGYASGNCPSASPKFVSLSDAGSIQQCSRCHGGSSPQSGLDISLYSSIIGLVQAGNPDQSILYQKVVPHGEMNPYSTQALNDAIYCWIQGGALQ